MNLLEKMRRINQLLQKTGAKPVDFREMAQVLQDLIHASVYVVSRKGKVLGYGAHRVPTASEKAAPTKIPEEDNAYLMAIEETLSNERDALKDNHLFNLPYKTIVPIIGGGRHLGTLLLERSDRPFGDEDLILAEYGATVVGSEILRENRERMEEETRNNAVVQLAIRSLSFSESEALEAIFQELGDSEGLLVASKVADRVGITRSVIVNALRKLESAGVLESRSLGMKGTYIKVLNPNLIPALNASKR